MKWLLTTLLFLCPESILHAQDAKADKYDATIDKGLAWLAKQQAADGSCSDANGFPVATTAFAGMAFLAEGSTLEQGKYRANLRKALDWFLKQKSKDKKYHGMLGDIEDPRNSGRYMPQHGVALSFLTKLYGEAEDKDDRVKVRTLLSDAVAFSVEAQATSGGWFYTSKIEGHDSTENVATMLQIQGLLDARDAGLPVPKETLKKAHAYIQSCTTQLGGIVYSGRSDMKNPPVAGGRPTINAMALAAYMTRQDRYDDTTRRWLAFCAEQPTLAPEHLKKNGDLLAPYFFCKVVRHLDVKQWQAAFPDKKLPDHMDWSKYRPALFDHLQLEQSKDGSWTGRGWSLGPVFNTSLALNILLYENTIPFRLSR